MVGMHLTRTRGGITTLAQSILRSPLNEEFEFTYIASQAEDFGHLRKLALAMTAYARFLVQAMRRPTLVYVHIGSNASLYRESLFVRTAKLLRLKVMAHFHAGDVIEYYRRQPIAGQAFISNSICSADLVIAVSAESESKIASIAPSARTRLIANRVDIDPFVEIPAERKNEKPRLLFIGAVGKAKGEQVLLEALGRLAKTGIRPLVNILGHNAGSLARRVHELGLTSQIEYMGPVATEERAKFFREADIFVLPTLAEAMPISLIEAMASALPVLTTRVGGIPELITDRENGLLVDPGDSQTLAAAIAELVGDPAYRSALGEAGRRKVLKECRFDEYALKLGHSMHELIGGRE